MMMALNAQSDCTEDSQGRQLRVSKKLSKAISSVPRSRFQKPRPNLPGSKRSDSSSVPVGARKSVETFQNKNGSSTSELKTVEELPNEKIESILKTDAGVSQELENGNTTVSSTVCTSEKADSCNNVILNIDSTSQKVEEVKSNLLLNTDVISVKEVDNTPKFSTDESLEKNEEDTASNAETLHGVEDRNSRTLEIEETSKQWDVEQDRHSLMLNKRDLHEEENDQSIIPEETVKENLINVEERVEEEGISLLSTTVETLHYKDNRSTEVLCTESLPDPPEQERNDVINITPNVTDRSSKYPHLTSILLSKKRTEPKKEVQHKRRKKFKKGDVAPERSKMTMADLIYWNPVNTDESAAKISTAVDEVPNSTNVEKEDCVDEDREENICGSVPKLVLSEDGQVTIDQTSLIVSRNVPQPIVTEVIGKDEATYSSFRKRPLTKHWSVKDTTIFYKALSLVGTDFGLMEKIFPHRTRRELKQKFKREEKYNIDLINRAMYESQLTFDADTLEDLIEHLNNLSDVNSENADDFGTPVKGKKKSLNGKQKTAKKTKCSNAELSDSEIESLPNEAVSKREVSNKRKRKTKKLPEDFLDIEEAETLDFEEANNSEVNEEKKNDKKRRSIKPLPSDFVDSDIIDELTEIACETSNNDEILEVNLNKSVESNQNDIELRSCIPVEYIENIDSVSSSTLLSDVMAYEVVTSQTPVAKRKKHTPNILNKNQTFIPLVLSSTNYTPS